MTKTFSIPKGRKSALLTLLSGSPKKKSIAEKCVTTKYGNKIKRMF